MHLPSCDALRLMAVSAHCLKHERNHQLNIHDAFQSKYIKAADLQGKVARLTISACQIEEIGDTDRKPVLYFNNTKKGLVVNPTNAWTLEDFFGFETDDWIGNEIELFAERVMFKNRPTLGLRIRRSSRQPAPQALQELGSVAASEAVPQRHTVPVAQNQGHQTIGTPAPKGEPVGMPNRPLPREPEGEPNIIEDMDLATVDEKDEIDEIPF